MAEVLIRHEADGVLEVFSAGTHPAQVRAEAVAVMWELGIDIRKRRCRTLTGPAGAAGRGEANISAATCEVLRGHGRS